MSLSGVLAYTGSSLANDLQDLEDRVLVQITPHELGIRKFRRECQRLRAATSMSSKYASSRRIYGLRGIENLLPADVILTPLH